MTKKIIAISTAGMIAAFAAPAMAQDAKPFDGPYVAAMGGWDRPRANVPIGEPVGKSGVLFGGVVGYDKNINGAVLGVEGEYSDSTTKKTLGNLIVPGDSARLKTGRDLYAGVRIGGEVVPGFMLYAKGGYTNAEFKGSYDNGVNLFSGKDKLEGYRLGAGVETNVSGLLARLEYRYSSYGHYEDTGVKPRRSQIAAMVGYRF